ncbi:MAG: hypothetical protein P794_07695 [Epsilonproteobacteria bacterium (ex Lamellibrachia satsuma)]|nr:MAG: hypothetical protein P794_07695 [Epsilonproteobacteria bacterium (ex Lamellibrachia satsuma)]
MTINLFQTPEYRALIEEHIVKTIDYLFSRNQEFALACEVKYINFDPELPLEIRKTFNETVLFILSGYTYETAKLEEGYFSFEAGFGNENFGSTVTVPLLAIKQLFVDDHPIVINLANPVSVKKASKNSMEALLNNPENKKLLKKKK